MPNTSSNTRVVGARVAGFTAGIYLARKGLDVKVIEVNPKFT